MLVKYLATKPNPRLAPFTFDWSLKQHGEMFGQVWEWAGEIRSKDLNLGKPFGTIRENLAALIDDLATWPSFKMPFLVQDAVY